MPYCALEIVEAAYDARRRRDVDAVLALCSDAIVYTSNIDPDKPGSGNTFIGKAQNRANLEVIDHVWELITSSVGPLKVIPTVPTHAERGFAPPATVIRCLIKFSIRHRASGNILEGTKTHEWTVREGKIVTLCETLDRDLVAAFMRMSEWAMRQTRVAPPAPMVVEQSTSEGVLK